MSVDVKQLRQFGCGRRVAGYTLEGVAMQTAADEIERLRAALGNAAGYLLNAKIDLETRATNGTERAFTQATNTIEGGIKMVRAALAKD